MRLYPEQYSPEVRRVLKAMSLTTVSVLGSADDPTIMYSGDYDMLEVAPVNVRGFQALVARASKCGTITDVKVGEVPEWNLVASPYSQTAELKRLGELWQKGIVTDTEVKNAKKVLKPHLGLREVLLAREELRFGVLRWTPAEVREGVLSYRGHTFHLDESMRTTGITKVDLVAWANEKYIEVSNILLWTAGGKTFVPEEDLAQSLGEDILTYEVEGAYMKVAKRMYSIAKAKNSEDAELLRDILNSHLGALYTVVSDLELLRDFPDATTKARRKKELEVMRDRMAKLYYPEFQDATAPSKLLPELKEVLERETREALRKAKLLPLSAPYKPKTS